MVKHKTRTTAYPPVGIAFETIEGPMTGSKSFQFYTPKGNETAVTVVGEWVSKSVPDGDLKNAVLAFLETVFDEDQKNLTKM
jgi:ABC-type phosphate transport system auxiliary subunit